MEPRKRSILDLFDGKRRYIVPLFQRQYVWSEEKQWAPLWEDILAKTTRRLLKQTTPPHFLGAIVLDQIKTFGNELPSHVIIDGQQRLTTFQVFLAAFRNFALKEGQGRYSEELDRYILNTGIMADEKIERYKVWPTKMDQQHYKTVIDCKTNDELNKSYPINTIMARAARPQMIKAYDYFYKALESYRDNTDLTQTAEEKIEVLYQSLRNDLMLVSIELEGDDDPQVIFETLNARGEPLLASDLLRNFIFLRAARQKEQQDELYQKYWSPFDSHFWKKEEKQGRLKRPRIDQFLQHFLAAKKSDDINVGRLFNEYKSWINTTAPYPSVSAELQDLDAFAAIYKQFLLPDRDTYLGKFVPVLYILDLTTIYPLLLYISVEAKKYIEAKKTDEIENVENAKFDFKGMLTDLESFLIRRMICNKTTKNYNRLFLQVLTGLKNNGLSRASLQKILKMGKGDAVNWPDDTELKSAWLVSPLYVQLSSGKLEMILRQVEYNLRKKVNEEIEIRSSLTIEHVMPQNWEEHWPLPDGTQAKTKVERYLTPEPAAILRDSLVHTIGNLTLLTQSLNSSVSNGPYTQKREAITAQSALTLNRYFNQHSTWGEDNIRIRAEELFNVAVERWPYPAIILEGKDSN